MRKLASRGANVPLLVGTGVRQGGGTTDDHYNAYVRRHQKGMHPVPSDLDKMSAEPDGDEPPRRSAIGSIAGDCNSLVATTLAHASKTGAKKRIRTAGSDAGDESVAPSTAKKAKKDSDLDVTTPLDDPSFESKPIQTWSAVQFLHAKSGLRMQSGIDCAQYNGPKGMILELKKAHDRAVEKGCDLDDLPNNTENLQNLLKVQSLVAIDVDVNLQTCKIENYIQLKGEVASNKAVTEELRKKFDEQYKCLEYKLTQKKTDSRKEQSRDTWQGTKIKTHLCKGGNGEGVAKTFGGGISLVMKKNGTQDVALLYQHMPDYVAVNPTKEQFKKDVVTVFQATSQGGEQVESLGYFHSLKGQIDDKIALMVVSMAENPRWKGCQSWLDLHIDSQMFDMLSEGIIDHPGSRLMLACLMNNAKRTSPTAIPNAGVSGVFFGTCDRLVWLLLLPIESFLKMGITLDGLDRFLDTTEGDKFAKESAVVVPILVGCAVFVPAGYATYAVAHEIIERNAVAGTSHFAHVTLGGPFCNDIGLSREVRHSIMTSNHTHLDAKAPSSKMWKARLEFFKGLFTAQ